MRATVRVSHTHTQCVGGHTFSSDYPVAPTELLWTMLVAGKLHV